MPSPALLTLELDLECFQGPFDLLLALILREEVDLLEVELADVVVAYLDHLQQRGELELEAATEFLVLIAALLELKSRLMLPGEEASEELGELEPAQAADELLARLLLYHRFRGAAGHFATAFTEGQRRLFRAAPPPLELRRAALDGVQEGALHPDTLGEAIGGLLALPKQIDLTHMAQPRVTVAERLAVLKDLLRRAGETASFDFDEAVKGADRQTVAMTIWALLELYKGGEGDWVQHEPFGPITVAAHTPAKAGQSLRRLPFA